MSWQHSGFVTSKPYCDFWHLGLWRKIGQYRLSGRPNLDTNGSRLHIETTKAGELLLSCARRLLATAEEAAEVMRKPSAPRTVRLGVPEDFAGRRLIDLLTGLSAASPHIRLDTVSG